MDSQSETDSESSCSETADEKFENRSRGQQRRRRNERAMRDGGDYGRGGGMQLQVPAERGGGRGGGQRRRE